MKKVKIIFVTAILLVLSLALFACGKDNLGDYAKDLTNYTIEAVYNDEAKTLEVTQSVDYYNSYDVELSELSFHLYPNAYREGARFSPIAADEIDAAYPNGVNYGGIQINSLKLNGKDASIVIGGQDDDILTVNFSTLLMPTERAKIEMTYTVNIPSVRHRLGYHDKTVNLGNFYPVACIYENGVFETSPYYSNGDPFYTHIANYNVGVTAPKNYTVAMSGKAASTELAETTRTHTTMKASRDFAIVLGEFELKSEIVDDTTVNYYYYNDETADDSLKVSVEAIKTFNSMFGKYPYSSVSVVQTHFLAGGMEYPGIVYISDASKGEIYRDTIVHEIAHQWWYGVVGSNQIEYAWLDESLAEYSATMFYEKNPSYNVEYSKRIADSLQAYTVYCDLYSTGLNTAMSRKVCDFRTQMEYTIMTYTKGQVMMDSLRKTIGETAFNNGLKRYYEQNYLSIARPENLIAAFESTSKKNLESFFETWLSGNVITFGKI